MKTIYKYSIPLLDEFDLDLPIGANILSFQTQDGVPCIWVMIDNDAEIEQRHFRLYGTGHPISEIASIQNLHYIGTTQMSIAPPLVWHLFEEVGEDSVFEEVEKEAKRRGH